MSITSFGTQVITETYWHVTIQGVTVKISEENMAELAVRFLNQEEITIPLGLRNLLPGWSNNK